MQYVNCPVLYKYICLLSPEAYIASPSTMKASQRGEFAVQFKINFSDLQKQLCDIFSNRHHIVIMDNQE